MKPKTFKLFANCIPVKGAKRWIIADLQRVEFYFISQGLFEILTVHKNKSVDFIKEYYDFQLDTFIDDSFNDLIEMELGFWCNYVDKFPDLSMNYHVPFEINNSIIEFNKTSNHNVKAIFNELSTMNCQFVELRFIDDWKISEIEAILALSLHTTFRNIELLFPYYEELETYDFDIFIFENQRVGNIIIYNSPYDKIVSLKSDAQFYFTTQDLSNNKHCGNISIGYFRINIATFTESQHHNTCLNRKISIDQNGNIKNCPSMTESYGNIANTTLQEALNHPNFKKYWNITKDQISVCQDCEFRHICTDCRAYVENPDDIYSKPLKCGYNPYTCEWEDWSTNPLKEKAMKYYGID